MVSSLFFVGKFHLSVSKRADRSMHFIKNFANGTALAVYFACVIIHAPT